MFRPFFSIALILMFGVGASIGAPNGVSDWSFMTRGLEGEFLQLRCTMTPHVLFALKSHQPFLPAPIRPLLSWSGWEGENPSVRLHATRLKKRKELALLVLEGVDEEAMTEFLTVWKAKSENPEIEKVEGYQLYTSKMSRGKWSWLYQGGELMGGNRKDLIALLELGPIWVSHPREWAWKGIPDRGKAVTELIRFQVICDWPFPKKKKAEMGRILSVLGLKLSESNRLLANIELEKGIGLVGKAYAPFSPGEGLLGKCLAPKSRPLASPLQSHPTEGGVARLTLPLQDFWRLWGELQYRWNELYGKEFEQELMEVSDILKYDLEGAFASHLDDGLDWGWLNPGPKSRSYFRLSLKKPIHLDELLAFIHWMEFKTSAILTKGEESELLVSSKQGLPLGKISLEKKSLWIFPGEKGEGYPNPKEFFKKEPLSIKERFGHQLRISSSGGKYLVNKALKQSPLPKMFWPMILDGIKGQDVFLDHRGEGLHLEMVFGYPNWRKAFSAFIPTLAEEN